VQRLQQTKKPTSLEELKEMSRNAVRSVTAQNDAISTTGTRLRSGHVPSNMWYKYCNY